ncbi:helix-turn-helix domain-containing protein [Leucobacter manosquensis]|uniref:Helix-turn-helix domain-containing protein n=1 Tax=Leucobacter manosquensis TaxID=2810611 RepID=A0ABS5M6D0_9MICO|nr:helix-turn-helix domain-containing protein [Leucobacter manosquensis]MBS3182400.1 helix-turn-helix domain-containing protein [Leucobacter manosquensis]
MVDNSVPTFLRSLTRGDHQGWQRLIEELEPEALTNSLLALLEQVDGYQSTPIPLSEIRRTTLLSFTAIIEGLRTGNLDVTIAHEIGTSRARAGIPLSSLLTAIRYDFSVLWDALVRIADERDASLIVRNTRTVLHAVDEYVGQAQRAYLSQVQLIREESASIRREHIESLFQYRHLTHEHLEMVARELQIPVNAPLLVAAAVRGDRLALQSCVSELHNLGVPFHALHFEGATLVFTEKTHRPRMLIEDLEERLKALRVGLMIAGGGLSDLRRAGMLARDMALMLSPDEVGAMTWERGWARQAARSLQAAEYPVLADVNAALSHCRETKRERILEAVHSYLETGNVGESARELYCHRNTISKHLRQFQDITGIDVTVPKQAARLVVGWA